MITIEGIQAADAPAMWPHVREWCLEALNRGGALIGIDDLKKGVADRTMQMWVTRENGKLLAVVLTEIVAWPQGQVLSAFVIGGTDMHKWLPAFDDTLSRYAREHGCKFLSGGGRKGWERVLKPLGWDSPSATYLKRL